jgi:hypothetical protein
MEQLEEQKTRRETSVPRWRLLDTVTESQMCLVLFIARHAPRVTGRRGCQAAAFPDKSDLCTTTDTPAEYRNKTMTKIFGSPYHGCYVLAVTIFSLGIFRDVL